MKAKPRYNRDGLPIDKNLWTVEDWALLWSGIQNIIKEIARRHERERDGESERETPHDKNTHL